MHLNSFMRRGHRWLSITFTLIVAAIFAALGSGIEPAAWVYFLPLAPLALLMVSGLYMYFLPFASRRRGERAGAT
jgi:Zn-dependent protease with chaperone function